MTSTPEWMGTFVKWSGENILRKERSFSRNRSSWRRKPGSPCGPCVQVQGSGPPGRSHWFGTSHWSLWRVWAPPSGFWGVDKGALTSEEWWLLCHCQRSSWSLNFQIPYSLCWWQGCCSAPSLTFHPFPNAILCLQSWPTFMYVGSICICSF